MKNRLIWLNAALLTTTWLTPALAQEARIAVRSKGLEEIIVTAQRRSQKLQSVPVSVTSFSLKKLTQAGITNTLAVPQVDPSLVVTTGSGVNSPFVRGVGNASATGLGNEASVPIYIDDVYFSRLNGAYLELANVDSIQVLKGPQGTLFGRNSSGGALLITTRDPGPKWKFEGEVGYASYNTITEKAYVAGPITDWLGVGLSVSNQKQGSGWGRNVVTNQATYTDNYTNVRGKIVVHPLEGTKITLSSFYVNDRSGQGDYNAIYNGTVGGIAPYPPYGGPGPIYPERNFYDSNSVRQDDVYSHGWGVSAKIEQSLGFMDFESITSFRQADETFLGTGQPGPYPFVKYNLYQYDREATQEVQFKSKPKSKIDWIVGAFFLDSRVGYYPTTLTGDAFSSGGIAYENIYGQQTIKSYSGYGQATVPIFTDRNHFTAGVRYSSDSVHGVGTSSYFIPGLGTLPAQTPYNATYPFHKVTYKFVVDRKFTDNILGYVSYSRGYKSGTFNLLPLTAAPTKSEVIDAYEVGAKTTLFDNRLRLNAALFDNEITNPQVLTIFNQGHANFVGLTNAKGARSQGAEFNADARITDALTARFGATYLNAYYTNFANAPFYYPAGAPNYGLAAPVIGNAKGNTLAEVPKWRFTTGANYDADTVAGHFNVDVNLAYTGKFAWNPDNIVRQNSYFLLNSTVTYTPAGYANWYVRGYASNMLGEKYYITELEDQGVQGVSAAPGAPRTFGVSLGFKF